jgi:dTDP-4-amino-4,6-dideoxygalactose transaminase
MRASVAPVSRALPRLQSVDEQGWYTNFGPQERELRERFADFFGVSSGRVMTANNATTALTGAISVGLSETRTVPSFTFAATPLAVLGARRNLVFADIGKDWWLSPADGLEAGLLPVAPFGNAVDIDRWSGHKNVVIDAAASIGAEHRNYQNLKDDGAIVFSLHATKVLGSGEGAVLVFGSEAYAEEFRVWTNFGFAGRRESTIFGANGKMSEVQACFVHAALDGWADEREEWLAARTLVSAAQKRLGLAGPPGEGNPISPYWIVAFPDGLLASAVEQSLEKAGIESRRWWGNGCHTMQAFRQFDLGEYLETEDAASRSLGLPMFRGIGANEIDRVEECISETMRSML